MVPEGWEVLKLGDVIKLGSGDTKPEDLESKPSALRPYPVYGGNNIMGYSSNNNSEVPIVLIGRVGEYCGVTRYIQQPCWITDNALYTKNVSAHIDVEYLSLTLKKYDLSRLRNKGGQPLISQKPIYGLKLPFPPLPEQKKIAQILSTWDKAISTTEQLLANSQQQKKALMQQLLTGKKRLLDENGLRFSGEWKFVVFSDAFKIANQKSTQVKSSDYLSFGDVPIVDQGQKLIAGFCNNSEHYKDIPVIIFGDHTRCIKWVDFAFCPGADGTQILVSRSTLDIKFGYFLLSHVDIPNLGYSRHMRVLKELEFKIPSDLREQHSIAAVLTLAENEIKKYEQKLEALKQEKKALMQQLLTGKRRVKVDEEAA